MRTILLQSGLTLLNTQTTSLNKLFITEFVASDAQATQTQVELWDNQEPALSVMQGNIVDSYGATNIYYVNGGNPDKARITCVIPQSDPQMTIGNVVLYAGFNENGSDKQPFCYSATDASVIKLQATSSSPGYEYIFNLMLDIYSLADRFDFSNLQTNLPEWLRVVNETYLPAAYLDGHDQFIINDHLEYPGLHPVWNVGNRFYGSPLAQDLSAIDTSQGYILDGGQVGDGM